MLGRLTGCFAIEKEGEFFERRSALAAEPDPRIRVRLVVRSLKLEDHDLAMRLEAHLLAWVEQQPQRADPLAIYREAMAFATHAARAWYWVQKATSYIFYIDEILRDLPDARVIYLLRNPYDVCASKKQRNVREERLVGWAMSWNKGLRLAQRAALMAPDRVHLMLYEDLVAQPQTQAQALCAFLGLPFEPVMLDVPHINAAEHKYQVVPGSRGLNASRVCRYVSLLSPAEMAALDVLLDDRLLKRFYPGLPHDRTSRGWRVRLAAWTLIAVGPLRYAADKIRAARKDDMPLIRRTIHRLGLR